MHKEAFSIQGFTVRENPEKHRRIHYDTYSIDTLGGEIARF
jgi:hypothetical protein